MLRNKQLRISEYGTLYDRLVPKDHLLRRITDLTDFEFVLDELRDKYSPDMGRTAISPIVLFKYLLLKCMYGLSDRDLAERSRYDMSFKCFLEYLPEDEVIHPSELTKFRKQRLQDEDLLDKLLNKSVALAIEQGVIEGRNLIVDSTHSLSRYNNLKPVDALKEQSKKLRKAVYLADEKKKDGMPTKPTGRNLDEEISYTKELLEKTESDKRLMMYADVREKANLLREMLDDNLEHLQTSEDPDAKVGHKTEDSSFFGYKTHLAMTEERIITAATITSGEKHDGKYLKTLVEKSKEAGLEIDAVIADSAYSEKDNIEYAEGKFRLVSRLIPAVSRGLRKDEDKFEYNKDAGMYVCPAGHMAIKKAYHHNKKKECKENPRTVYYFDTERCKHCAQRKGCYKDGAKIKSYSVSIISEPHKAQLTFQESEQFKKLSKQRYKIEAKNGELKNRLGYGKAESSGIQAMRIQGATALFAANLKRIITLTDEKTKKTASG